MSDLGLPRDGGCLCGRVRFKVGAPPLFTSACHCRGCQRLSASAFSLTVCVPGEGFAVTAGEPVIGGLHGPHRHYFCPHCKNWLFTRPAGFEGMVNVRSTMLDDPGAWATPFIETQTAERLPWATTPAVHSYPAWPPPEDYEGLLREYAARADPAAAAPA